MLLAKFFKVHPGYLVDDPEGYQEELVSDVGALEDKLDLWLISGAERFRRDPELSQALLRVARHDDSRMCVVLLGTILDNPGLAERLMEVLEARRRSRASAEARRQSMNWADFYLICFLVGLALSPLAVLAGSAHLHCRICRTSCTCRTGMRRAGGGRRRSAVAEFRHDHGVSGLVRRHGLSAGALLRTSGFWLALVVAMLSGLGGARRWCSGFWPSCCRRMRRRSIRRTTTWSACWAS